MKDLHIKLDNVESKMIEDLQKKYKCSKTDLISSLLEIAWNSTCNEQCYEYWDNHDEHMVRFMDEYHFELFDAVNNRK